MDSKCLTNQPGVLNILAHVGIRHNSAVDTIRLNCKKVIDFSVPSRGVTKKLSLDGNYLIIPVQGEFG